MIVHGLLRADGGSLSQSVTFTLDDREEWIPLENRTASVRLQDGDTELEGRLEVDLGDGVWGTVCNDVSGGVWGTVCNHVSGGVWGTVCNDISGGVWGTVCNDVSSGVQGSVCNDVSGGVWGYCV